MAKAAEKKKSTRAKAKPSEPEFDKYDFYRRAVQSPDTDVEFLRNTYRELKLHDPLTLREDFCGTFNICCEWVKLNNKHLAHGIDFDPEPIAYGCDQNLPELTASQRERIEIHQENVLNPGLPHADIIAAMNFSHYIFKDRAVMKSYFHNCYATLNVGGIFVADCFGGSRCFEENEDSTDHRAFTYYWHQKSYDPVTGHAQFAIHFKPKGRRKRKDVFTYDWRIWSIPELREMMMETGFRKTHVYWEGTTKSGEGDGVFRATDIGEECQAWIAYVIGEK
jgi:hypothetical protein